MNILGFLKRDRRPKRRAIIDVTDASFEHQVVRRSYKGTVLVDYWAAWCVPCRQLGPVLERIAEDPDSDFILAKLNTEHNQKTAAKYNIRSIPAVKAFRNGTVVREFTGALPETLVRRFVDKVNSSPPPAAKVRGSADPAKRLRQAELHLKKGRGFEAFVTLNDFPQSKYSDRAEALLPLARFLFDMEDGDGLTGEDHLDDAYLDAADALNQKKPAQALEFLFAALDEGGTRYHDQTSRVIESLLTLLGEKSKLAREYRPRLGD